MVNGVLNAFAYIAKWLREMSLAGGAQNVFAICMFCLIGCVPLSGFIVLCIRNRKLMLTTCCWDFQQCFS